MRYIITLFSSIGAEIVSICEGELSTMADTVAPISTPVLSFPAILRNPGLKDRFAHLHGEPSAANSLAPSSQIRVKKVRTDQNEGKRWVRRKDNGPFSIVSSGPTEGDEYLLSYIWFP